jgi:hypothetical protein
VLRLRAFPTAMTSDAVTAKLLDFSQDAQTYVQYLDRVVDTFYSTGNKDEVRVSGLRSVATNAG